MQSCFGDFRVFQFSWIALNSLDQNGNLRWLMLVFPTVTDCGSYIHMCVFTHLCVMCHTV